MADTPPATKPSGSTFGFLGHKVFGKVPVWVIAVAGVGGYYAWTHYGPGKKTGAATVTDPAGNTCSALNPATGYCPGTPEDAAAIASTSGADIGGTSGTVDTTGAGAGTGSGGTGGGTDGGTGATSTTPIADTTPPPATTGAPPPPVVIPAAPPPPDHAAAHRKHVAHEAHLAEERRDAAQAAAARRAHRGRTVHVKTKGAHR